LKIMSFTEAVAKLQKLYMRYDQVVSQLLTLQARLRELREAKKYLEKGVGRRVYREVAELVIEVTEEEARKYVEEEEELVRLRIRKLEEEKNKLLQDIRNYERILE